MVGNLTNDLLVYISSDDKDSHLEFGGERLFFF